jgi:hypothetical protein
MARKEEWEKQNEKRWRTEKKLRDSPGRAGRKVT